MNQHKVRSYDTEWQAVALLSRLQILNQDVSETFGKVSKDMVARMPRIVYDLTWMKDEAASVRQVVDSVKEQITSLDDETAKGLLHLKQLDLVKTRMEACRAALKEADNWINLEVEAKAFIEAKDFEKAGGRLEDAGKSLQVFHNTADYAYRQELLARLRDDLEEAVRPLLDRALQARDAVASRRFYRIYQQLGQEDIFFNVYFNERSVKIRSIWSNFSLTSEVIDESATAFSHLLSQFHQEVFIVLSEEYAWCTNIVNDPKLVIYKFLQHIFAHLDPSFATRLSSITLHEGALEHLIQAFTITVELEKSLSRAGILGESSHILSHALSPAQDSIASRRDVDRRSASSASALSGRPPLQDDPTAWAYVLFEPFLPYQRDYGDYELRYLTSKSDAVVEQARKMAHLERAKFLIDNTVKFFEGPSNAVHHCTSFTFGFGAPGMLNSLNKYFDTITQAFEKMAEEEPVVKRPVLSPRNSRRFSGMALPSVASFSLEGAASGGETDQWSDFQARLSWLKLCQVLDDRLYSLEVDVEHALRSCEIHVLGYEREDSVASLAAPLFRHSSLSNRSSISTKRDRRQSVKHRESIKADSGLYPSTRRRSFSISPQFQQTQDRKPASAAVSLLRSSTLNNFELARIFESLDKTDDVLLLPARQALLRCIAACRMNVYKSIEAHVTKSLKNLRHNDRLWNDQAFDRRRSRSILNNMPKFSLSPSEYITKVGEQLLMLPPHLEMYSDNDTLGLIVDDLPYMTKQEPTETGESDKVSDFVGGMDQQEELQTPTASASPTTIRKRFHSNHSQLTTEDITHRWMTSVSRGVMHTVVQEILAIPYLSASGAKQLATDIEYLVNVLTAFDVEPTDEITQILRAVQMEASELSEAKVEQRTEIQDVIAKMRRVHVS
ncbi:hypothetical protein BZG36_04937 [Bifiguratus adelaidae]|uniref:Conserved oligomeric Golgi complex subunit 7 n=1 Tax=Bifiguratus adelaidae TaxID=1938954 RepID=A0A261XX46_9FUNG|nr:hypothetical protein BZG36_04937 [Bifiguratus adelaidae]